MIRPLTKHEMIRQAQDAIGKDASNKKIKQYCNDNFGVTPISQTIYSAIGSEFSRSAGKYFSKRIVRQQEVCKENI